MVDHHHPGAVNVARGGTCGLNILFVLVMMMMMMRAMLHGETESIGG